MQDLTWLRQEAGQTYGSVRTSSGGPLRWRSARTGSAPFSQIGSAIAGAATMVAVRSRLTSIDRVVTVLLITVLLSVVAIVQPAAASPYQTDEPTSTLAPEDAPDIIPRPNTGSAPDDAGDRGGSLQSALFVVVIGGIVLIGVLIARESRRSRHERGF